VGNQLTYLWEGRSVTRQFTTAVSLHGHTNRSKESLYFISDFASERAPLRWGLAYYDRVAQRKSSIQFDFCRAYWTPPLPPLQAFTVERQQIEDGLGMRSLISLTDHDNIEAPLLLRVVPEARRIPVSLEWTAPFAGTDFHLGVHNLPTAEASVWLKRMAAYTAQPRPQELRELLAALVSIPQVLLVFNHPLWDLPNIGKTAHRQAVRDLLSMANAFLHAFELGGLRGWKENHEVIELARAYRRPVIAGGDRHGCEPSGLLNLTNAESFSEFVEEVRQGHSHVLAMPQYADCTTLRVYHTLLDVIRYYPDHPIGTRNWDERVFHPDSKGVPRPLSILWDAPPLFVKYVFDSLRMGEAEPVRRTLQFAFNRGPQGPRLELERGQEASL
jgi:hypothetical protein